MDVHKYLSDLSALLLPDTPVYVVLASDEPPRELWSQRAAGFTSPLADAWFQPWLKSRGLWQGRRACFAVDDRGLASEAQPNATDWAARAWQADTMHTVAGITVHELGHIADHPVDHRPLTPPVEQDAREVLQFAKLDDESARPRADYHSPCWLRITTHLLHRAHAAGHGIACDMVYAGNFGTPPISSALLALEGELEQLANVPAAKINDIPAPAEFVSMCEFWLRRWRSEQQPMDADADSIVRRSERGLVGITGQIKITTNDLPRIAASTSR